MKIHFRRNNFLPLTAALALLVNQATAAIFTWDGDTSQFWNNAGNWVEGALVSANTTDIIISGTANVGTMYPGNVSYTIKSLTFDASNDANTTFSMQNGGNAGQGSRNLTFSSNSGNATLTVESGSTGNKTIDRLGTIAAATITLTSSLDVIHNGSGTLTLGKADNVSVTGGGGINKSGTGTLSLLGANTYLGATNVTDGTLSLGHATDTLSSSSAVAVDGATAVLSIAGNSDTVGAVSLKNGGSITGTGGTLTGASYAVESGSVSAILGGAGIALTKSTAGTVTLSGANTYTGNTLVSAGKIVLGSALALQNSAYDTASVNGGLEVTGFTTPTLGGLTGSVNLTSTLITGYGSISTLTLNPQTGITNTYSGDVGNGNGSMALTKTGPGTQVLSGANTYTGATSINEGKLVVGSGGTGSITSNVTVNNGGTLGGSGTITGTLTVKDGGTHNAGNSPGIQTITGNTTYETGSIFAWDLSANKSTATGTRGTDYDGVTVTAGDLTVESGAIFRVIQNAGVDFTDTFWNTNQNWTDIFSVSGTLTGWAADTSVAVYDTSNVLQNVSSYGSFTVTGSTLSWTAIPEPTSALAGLLLTAGLLRRRRNVGC